MENRNIKKVKEYLGQKIILFKKLNNIIKKKNKTTRYGTLINGMWIRQTIKITDVPVKATKLKWTYAGYVASNDLGK